MTHLYKRITKPKRRSVSKRKKSATVLHYPVGCIYLRKLVQQDVCLRNAASLNARAWNCHCRPQLQCRFPPQQQKPLDPSPQIATSPTNMLPHSLPIKASVKACTEVKRLLSRGLCDENSDTQSYTAWQCRKEPMACFASTWRAPCPEV